MNYSNIVICAVSQSVYAISVEKVIFKNLISINVKTTRMTVKQLATGVAFCMLGMAGCSNERIENLDTQVGGQVPITMQATSSQTRADYATNGSDQMSFSWRSGDAISVVVNGTGGNENYRLTTGTSGKSTPFNGTVAGWGRGDKTLYAFYPYNSKAYTVASGDTPESATTTLTLPHSQSYTVGGAVSNSLLVGLGTATAEGGNINAAAGMKQVMSIIKLNINNVPADAKVARVKLMCDEAVFPTTATVKLSDATITNLGAEVKELTMNVADNATGATKAVSFAMFPTHLTGKKIRVEVTYDDIMKWRIIEKDGTDFVRNMHYVMAFDGTPTVWADGNLIAKGENGAEIGAKTNGSLYFQFGSLLGWAGGATGDGKGMPPTSVAATINV